MACHLAALSEVFFPALVSFLAQLLGPARARSLEAPLRFLLPGMGLLRVATLHLASGIAHQTGCFFQVLHHLSRERRADFPPPLRQLSSPLGETSFPLGTLQKTVAE